MTTALSIRELTRSSSRLADYDYIDIEDRKSREYKGLFVPAQYAAEVKAFLDEKIEAERQERRDSLMQFAGLAEGDFGHRRIQDLKGEGVGEGSGEG